MTFQNIEPIAITSENTVVAELDPKTNRAQAYESESELETAFIELLKDQAYDYLPVTDEAALIANLKIQIEKLNKVCLYVNHLGLLISSVPHHLIHF